MKVRVDPLLCQGHSLCVLMAPELFAIDDKTGLAIARREELGDEHRAAAVDAARSCPVRAIVLFDEKA